MTITIKKIRDFPVTGAGSHESWNVTGWHELKPIGRGRLNYQTRTKILWSENGIYFLFECEDKILTCTITGHFKEIYLEDVIEVFLWPDETQVIYYDENPRTRWSWVTTVGENFHNFSCYGNFIFGE